MLKEASWEEGKRKRALNYSCNKIAKQQLAKWKVGVKKETSEDFSQLRLIIVASEAAEAHKRKEETSSWYFLAIMFRGACYGRRVGTFGVSIVS